ncbi:MAG TPA: hypothetical protein VGA18_04750, partial [Rhodothermales bacterium]
LLFLVSLDGAFAVGDQPFRRTTTLLVFFEFLLVPLDSCDEALSFVLEVRNVVRQIAAELVDPDDPAIDVLKPNERHNLCARMLGGGHKGELGIWIWM